MPDRWTQIRAILTTGRRRHLFARGRHVVGAHVRYHVCDDTVIASDEFELGIICLGEELRLGRREPLGLTDAWELPHQLAVFERHDQVQARATRQGT